MKKTILPIICIVFFLLIFSCGKPTPVSRQEIAFGTVCSITLYEKNAEKVLEQCFLRLQELDDIFNVNEEESEINLINKNAGIKPVMVSDEVFFVLKTAKEFAKITDGNFDPTIGPLVRVWNISGGNSIVPSEKKIEKAKALVDYNKLILDEFSKTAYIESNMSLDVGGIAKGFAADEIAKILTENNISQGIINLGGNVYAYGSKKDGNKSEKWNIGIKNPLLPNSGVAFSVKVENMSVVTSGNYERFFEKDGIRYHHIIDGKTGYPTQNGIISFTIIDESSMIADVLSTSCFVLGREKGISLLEKLDIMGFCVTDDNNVYITRDLENCFEILDESFSF